MLRTLVFFMFLLVPMITKAQVPPGYTQITDPSVFKSKFAEVANSTKSIRSDFSQEKTMTMLSEKIVSQGKFYFKKESKVRMEYLSPFKYLMIINGTKVYIRDGEKVTTVSTGSNKIFRQVSQIMLDCVSGNMLMNPDFDTRVFENKSNYLIEMKPVSKGIMEFFNTILVYVDKTDHSVSKIQMTEGSGDFTIMNFTNKELNRELSDSLFLL
jgi:outer membrane lipoprotein-sorting protein